MLVGTLFLFPLPRRDQQGTVLIDAALLSLGSRVYSAGAVHASRCSTWTFCCSASMRGFGHARQHCLEIEPSSYKRCALGLQRLNRLRLTLVRFLRIHRKWSGCTTGDAFNMLDVGFECVDSRHGLPGIDDMKLGLDTFGDMSAPLRDMSTSAVTARCEILTSASALR
jgi:hypothetical protein